MKKLYYIRHGLTELNAQGRLAGRTETPLTDEGRRQAKKAGKQAKKLSIDLIVASPMSRTRETAEIIAHETDYPLEKIIFNKLLLERDFGPLEGSPWSPDLNLDGMSDIETDDTLVERARLALQWLESLNAENILVVSHGAFGRALRSILKHDYPMSRYERLKNAEIHNWL